jgi:cytochrome c oxidase subunit II
MNKPTSNPNAGFNRWALYSLVFGLYFFAGIAYNMWKGEHGNPIFQIFFLPATVMLAINPIHLPINASGQGAGIDRLNVMIHGLMGILFFGWVGYFGYVLFRFRRNVNPSADYVGVKSHISTYIEGIVALVEGALLVGLAIPLWAHAVQEFPKEQDSTVIRVIGQQFLWNAWYPGQDGFGTLDPNSGNVDLDAKNPKSKGNFIVKNDLVVPINKPVIVHISSRDVIHSFASKPLRVTQDAMPGLNIPAWFKPTRLGKYWIQCAQLCGNGHYSMRGSVTVVSEDDYKKFIAEHAKSAGEGGGGYE